MGCAASVAARNGVIPERGDRLLPAASALLAVIAFPPFHLLIPSFVALVPLAVWVTDQNDGWDRFEKKLWPYLAVAPEKTKLTVQIWLEELFG